MTLNSSLMARPIISVIIPTYNRGEYLGRTLSSVFKTGYESLEVIVIDDESTDNTGAVVEPYINEGLIQYLRILNDGMCGPASAINAGLRLASGELIHCLDADDCVLPSYYEEVLHVFNSDPRVDAVSAFASVIDSEDRVMGKYVYPDYSTPHEFRVKSLLGNQVISSSMIVKRSCYDVVGGRRPELQICCDYDLWLRVGERFNVHLIREVLVSYRRHESNISSSTEQMAQYDRSIVADYVHRNTVEFFIPENVQRDRRAAAQYLSALAALLECRGFYELMVPFLLGAIARSPRDSDLYAALGSSYYAQGVFTKARFYIERALRLNGENKKASSLLGLLMEPLSSNPG